MGVFFRPCLTLKGSAPQGACAPWPHDRSSEETTARVFDSRGSSGAAQYRAPFPPSYS